jgi:hypothetical protein
LAYTLINALEQIAFNGNNLLFKDKSGKVASENLTIYDGLFAEVTYGLLTEKVFTSENIGH